MEGEEEMKTQDNSKINEVESLDKYFPKGDKRRGEALVLCAEAFLLGKTQAFEEVEKIIDEICYSYDGELPDGKPKMHRILLGDREDSWIFRDKLLSKLKEAQKK
jgi:hypothetical protein